MKPRMYCKFFVFSALFAVLLLAAGSVQAGETNKIAAVNIGQTQVFWQALVENNGGVLTVNGPGDYHFRQEFKAGQQASFEIQSLMDGTFTFELSLYPALKPEVAKAMDRARKDGTRVSVGEPMIMSGAFTIQDGSLIFPQAIEPGKPAGATVDNDDGVAKDQVITDDLIVQMSACIGNDCNNGENFGFDTLRLKENNTRIKFDDTSNSASFPYVDWQLTANESDNGGANKFSIEDITNGRIPFTIEAASASNSLYVDSNGSVGFGTGTPVVELHVKDGDTPTLRLEQDGSSGFTPQTWDVAGNEANFFVRDVTNGSELPFKIKPGADDNALYIDADNDVGISTASPTGRLDVNEPSNNNVKLVVRNNTVSTYVNATDSEANFGTSTDHPVRLAVNSQWKMRLDSDNSLTMQSGATCTSGGVWTSVSTRERKENISDLTTDEATQALRELAPVKFNYKAEQGEQYVGFIAEDVPELVASSDRKHLTPMDVVAVLTKVVQEQQQRIDQLEQKLAELQ